MKANNNNIQVSENTQKFINIMAELHQIENKLYTEFPDTFEDDALTDAFQALNKRLEETCGSIIGQELVESNYTQL